MKDYNTLDDFDFENKTMLLRVDFNRPINLCQRSHWQRIIRKEPIPFLLRLGTNALFIDWVIRSGSPILECTIRLGKPSWRGNRSEPWRQSSREAQRV